ncbi:CrtK protein [Croceicoccus estronivorus]|uniref:TspO/MBR family protein n=1 Tax=Croceicoccus estronivorus TaxID=1172626 RepID=UPI000833F54E|nr:TspO/MBR family protein [Croceicoccus estronivorus]OCC22763.1 CrtK protein [Croceicoccus estronivorus]
MNLLASRGQLRASFARWALLLVPAVLLAGFLSGEFSGSGPDNLWFASLEKPGIYPPPATFGIVWTILYALMGLAFAIVCSSWGARGRGAAIGAFLIQLGLNLAWSPVFFGAHQISAALVLLVVLDVFVLITLALFWRIRWYAGLLFVPYLAWVLFASLLTWQFLELNPGADGREVSGAVQRIEL